MRLRSIDVSREHARISYEKPENKYYINDLNSQHGTLVNSDYIDQESKQHQLKDGDRVHIAGRVFIFNIVSEVF